VRLLLAVCVTGALGACAFGGDDASEDGGGPTLVVGSANFPENALLAELYAGALEAEGLDVTTKLNVGSRETLFPAMERGDVTVVPEYTGALLSYLSKGAADARDTAGQVAAIAEALPEDLVLLEPSQAQDQETITCTADVVEQHSLTSIADLAPVSRQLTFGGPPELPSRKGFGLEGLKDVYGVEFESFQPLDVSGPLTVSALEEGKVDCANLFSTQSAIEVNGFVSLTDPEGLVESEAVVPLVSRDAATPEVEDALNAVSAALTTETLKAMVKQVEVDKADPRTVAQEFLDDVRA
jgi:osmoprotectant transport system substrate-binding protein